MDLIDTHIHLWDLDKLTYAWLRDVDPAEEAVLGNYDAIRTNYLIEDYLADIKSHGVSKAVHVQAAIGHPHPEEETAWLSEIADRHGYPHAIIGACDLCQPDVEAVLEGHMAFSRFRGVRMLGTRNLLETAEFQRGFARLPAHGLIYELDGSVEDMAPGFRLAKKFSDAPIVMTHTGLPLQRSADYFNYWRAEISALAKAENVICKISGLGMTDHAWTTESIRPWVEASIDIFGPKRCMFGTNWPVDSLYSSYGALIDAYREIIRGFSPHEQRQLLQGTAETLYKL